MRHKIVEWQARGDKWLDLLSRRRPMIGLVVSLLVVISGLVFWGWIEGTALPWLWRTILTVAAMPVGIVALAGVIVLLSIVVAAFWDTSPNAAALKQWLENRKKPTSEPEPAEPAKPPPLSPDEIHKIQFARGFWRDVGDKASGDIEWLLLGVQQELSPKHRLAVHLMEPKNALERLRESLDFALDDNAQVPLNEVVGLIVATFKCYMEGVRWLHDCSDTYGVNLEAEAHVARYRHWQGLHPVFVTKAKELSDFAGYRALRYPVQHEGATDIRFKKVGD